MDLTAKCRVGATVLLGRMSMRRIVARKWDFQRGLFNYLVEGSRPDRNWTMPEDEVERRIKAASEEVA